MVFCFKDEQVMSHLPFAWVVWLILTATSLNTVSAFVPDQSSPLWSQNSTFALSQLQLDDSPLGEDVSVPGKGRWNFWGIEQQSKQILALVRSHDLVSLVSRRENLLRSAPAPVFLPFRAWFPRKLSPPSAQDDPFLS